MAKQIEPYGAMFFEEPVLPEYPEAMAEVRRVGRIPVATGERLFTRYPFRDRLTRQAVDVVQPDRCTVGGILEGYKIATVIALHLDSVAPNFLIQEATQNPDRDNILNRRVEVVQNGYMAPPDGHGWGVELNEEFLRAQGHQERRMFPLQFAEDGAIVDL